MALSGLVSYGSSDESESESETESPGPSSRVVLRPVNGSAGPSSGNGSAGPSGDVSAGPSSDVSAGLSSSGIAPKQDLDIDDSVIDDQIVGPALPTSLGLPKPKYSASETLEPDVIPLGPDDVTRGLSTLPKAMMSRDSNFKGNSDDEVEEEFKQLPKNVHLPTKPSKKSGKVRISLPALPSMDSDDDDDEPKVKKPKLQPSSGKSGLIGLLPQPKHVAVKETNRPLVPHTLTKKPASKTAVTKKMVGNKMPKIVDVASDSEDDGEDANEFFTFSGSSVASGSRSGGISVRSAPVVEAVPNVSEPPLAFDSSAASASVSYETSVPRNYTGNTGPLPYQPPTVPSYPTGYGEASGSGQAPGLDFETHQKLIQDEQFKRMVGKNFRGEEVLDIMEVKADDQMATHIDVTKSLTEEKSNMSYSKKRKDLPSQLSRRKHQITYLAFQAKERELELKNQWSQNKSTKRQSQAKYGF